MFHNSWTFFRIRYAPKHSNQNYSFYWRGFFWHKYSEDFEGGSLYHKTRFARYELRITNYKLRVESLKAKVETSRCYELRVQIGEFKITVYLFKSTNEEFELTSYDFKPQVARKSMNSKTIKSMKTKAIGLRKLDKLWAYLCILPELIWRDF